MKTACSIGLRSWRQHKAFELNRQAGAPLQTDQRLRFCAGVLIEYADCVEIGAAPAYDSLFACLRKQRIFAANQPINRVSISSVGRNGQVAQSVEHRIENPGVAGSIPALSTQIAICVEREWLFLWHLRQRCPLDRHPSAYLSASDAILNMLECEHVDLGRVNERCGSDWRISLRLAC